jgi:hypothetical protein
MKDILAVNRVNFKGVMEKEELLKIVERLWKTERQLLEGTESVFPDSCPLSVLLF